MDFYEYRIGKGIDIENIWSIFDEGKGYIEKYKSMEVYALRLQFDSALNLPLFDHEAISKTVKSLFHDLKKECLPESEYDHFGPIFLYEINRGSAIWTFVAELKPLLILSTVLSIALIWRKYEGQSTDNLNKKIDYIRKLYPRAPVLDIQDFTHAWTAIGRKKVLKRLAEQGLKSIKISKQPFKGQKDIEVIDVSAIIEDND